MNPADETSLKTLWKGLLASEEEHGTERTVLTSHRPTAAVSSIGDVDSLPVTEGGTAAAEISVGSAVLCQPVGAATSDRREEASYQVLAEVGKGGMGVVFEAMQTSIGRHVALKVTKHQDPVSLSMFFSEARVTGRLEHANIVPVHDLGRTQSGLPYLTLKLLSGVPWSSLIHSAAGASPALKEHIRILLAVCNAMAYAHQHGVLHRDLKPNNIMVGEFGQVFVMDWGLAAGIPSTAGSCRAKDIVEVSLLSQVSGTPAYMAPELAMGDGKSQDERTDIYLLGACLHEVLTGQPPHTGTILVDVLRAAVESCPFEYGPEVPRELADICHRAMARTPGDRFGRVAEFAVALESFLSHEQARVLTQKGLGLLRTLQGVAREAVSALSTDREVVEREIHQLHGEARFAFRHALDIWPAAQETLDGAKMLAETMMDHALSIEDVNMASRLEGEVSNPHLLARLEQLRERIAAKERELAVLRDTVRQLDASAMVRPLGRSLILIAALGGAWMVASLILRIALPEYDTPQLRFFLWVPAVLAAGATTLKEFQRLRLVGRLIAFHTLGMLTAIVVASFFVECVGLLLRLPAYRLLAIHALLIGVAMAFIAFQAHRWLLVPAGMFYLGSLVIASFPAAGRELLGALLFLALGGVGVFLLRTPFPRVTSPTAEPTPDTRTS